MVDVTDHMSDVADHISDVTDHMSDVADHMSHVAHSRCESFFFLNRSSSFTHTVVNVISNLSFVMCHITRLMCDLTACVLQRPDVR